MKFLSDSEFHAIFKNAFDHVFIRAEFSQLNSRKADELFYFSWEEDFGMIFAVKNGILSSPFSSPYSGIAINKSIDKIELFFKELFEWAKSKAISNIEISIPPIESLQKEINGIESVLNHYFELKYAETLQLFELKNFSSDSFFPGTQKNAIKNYNKALSENLSFRKISNNEDIKKTYSINKHNRISKNRPMNMTLEEIRNHENLFPIDFFGVYTEDNQMISAAIVFNISQKVSLVQYWAHIEEYQELRPMNILAFNLCEYYKKKGIEILDLGISSYKGVLNDGLFRFKKSIGAIDVKKSTYTLNLDK